MRRNLIWADDDGTDEAMMIALEAEEGDGRVSEVKSSHNRIYFYTDVNTKSILTLNQEIRAMRNNLKYQALVQETNPPPIWLHVNSSGGTVIDGFSAMDVIIRCDVPIYSIVDGAAASAATFLTIVANKRYITQHSYMLIHQISSRVWGTYHNIKDENQNLEELMDTIRKLYGQYTKIPPEELEKILEHDLYFNAEKCLEYGLVDEIL